LCSYYSY